jgi:hypothetical protein
VFVEYGVIDILDGHIALLDGGGDADVRRGIRRLREARYWASMEEKEKQYIRRAHLSPSVSSSSSPFFQDWRLA